MSLEVERCWSRRSDWWPVYHFACTSLTAVHTPLTVAHTSLTTAHTSLTTQHPQPSDPLLPKCIVASVLLGKG